MTMLIAVPAMATAITESENVSRMMAYLGCKRVLQRDSHGTRTGADHNAFSRAAGQSEDSTQSRCSGDPQRRERSSTFRRTPARVLLGRYGRLPIESRSAGNRWRSPRSADQQKPKCRQKLLTPRRALVRGRRSRASDALTASEARTAVVPAKGYDMIGFWLPCSWRKEYRKGGPS
jgi:hypothetical protein